MPKNYYCYRYYYYRKYTVIQTCAMRTADTKLMFPFGRTWFSLDSSLPTSVVRVTSTSVLSHNNTESVMTIMPDDIVPELVLVLFWAGTMSLRSGPPRVRPGHPISPLSLHFPVCCSFLLFPFLVGFKYFLLLSTPFLSTKIVPLHFQAGGRRKRPNLGLLRCVYFVLSVFLS